MSNRRERDSQHMDRVLLRAVQLLNHGDNTVPDCSQPPEEELPAILREEVEIAVAALKKEKSAAELVQPGGKSMIDVLTKISNKIWKTGEWPTPCT